MSGGIKLNWRDRNFSESSHNIYRSDTTMSLSNMPAPIATVGANVTEYIDYDVIQGNTYYYRIGAIRGNDEAISDELEIIAEEPDLGPGSDVLIGGDDYHGFFGEVLSSEFISGDDLATSLGITQGTSQYSDTPWLKYSLNGEIIYIPKKPIRHSISWEHIYQAGAVYGTDDFGLNPSGGDRLQDARVMIDGYEFKVTLLKGGNSDPVIYPGGGYDMDYTHSSEWNMLMYPVHIGTGYQSSAYNLIPSVSFNQWASYSDDDLIVDYRAGSGSYSWAQESIDNTTTVNRMVRGYFGATYTYSYSGTNGTGWYGWRPALRMVS